MTKVYLKMRALFLSPEKSLAMLLSNFSYYPARGVSIHPTEVGLETGCECERVNHLSTSS